MNKGKRKCEILKTIRCQVAKKNGIEYTYTECTYQGECRGTCPKCEEELRYLTGELEKLKRSGKQVAVAGVAAAVIAAGAAGCASDIPMDPDLPFTEVYETKGAMAAPEELDGDVAYTPDPEDTPTAELQGNILPPEEYVTAGEPLPTVPLIEDVLKGLEQGGELSYGGISRPDLHLEWGGHLTEQGENYDIFTVDGTQIIVSYDEYGWINIAALYGGTTVVDEN